VLTKHIHDLAVEELKVEVMPKIIDNTMLLNAANITHKPKGKMKARMGKAKVTAKRSRLEKATSHLYDLENSVGPEKQLNIDFGIYQMENY
jgi:hypothetical protein